MPDSTDPLSNSDRWMIGTVSVLLLVLGVFGAINSFAAVSKIVEPSFGSLAWTVPLIIDIGIAATTLTDILQSRLAHRTVWLRWVPLILMGATIYLNVAGKDLVGAIAHAAVLSLWIVGTEAMSHTYRWHAGLTRGNQRQEIESIRSSRWIWAPVSTLRLRRRMILWEVTDYTEAVRREQERRLAKAQLVTQHGRVAWRWRAPLEQRTIYQMGQLVPARVKHTLEREGGEGAVEAVEVAAIEAAPAPVAHPDRAAELIDYISQLPRTTKLPVEATPEILERLNADPALDVAGEVGKYIAASRPPRSSRPRTARNGAAEPSPSPTTTGEVPITVVPVLTAPLARELVAVDQLSEEQASKLVAVANTVRAALSAGQTINGTEVARRLGWGESTGRRWFNQWRNLEYFLANGPSEGEVSAPSSAPVATPAPARVIDGSGDDNVDVPFPRPVEHVAGDVEHVTGGHRRGAPPFLQAVARVGELDDDFTPAAGA